RTPGQGRGGGRRRLPQNPDERGALGALRRVRARHGGRDLPRTRRGNEGKGMTEIKGICPIAAAPFTERGAVDEESFQSLVRHLLGTGVRALTLFGLATEYYKLDDGEKERLRRLMLRETSSRADVAGIVSVTDHSWEVAARR